MKLTPGICRGFVNIVLKWSKVGHIHDECVRYSSKTESSRSRHMLPAFGDGGPEPFIHQPPFGLKRDAASEAGVFIYQLLRDCCW